MHKTFSARHTEEKKIFIPSSASLLDYRFFGIIFLNSDLYQV
jgi:hypothetical protein